MGWREFENFLKKKSLTEKNINFRKIRQYDTEETGLVISLYNSMLKMLGSNLDRDNSYPASGFPWFFQFLHVNAGMLLPLCQDLLFPNPY
jgi:hypothetical protein